MCTSDKSASSNGLIVRQVATDLVNYIYEPAVWPFSAFVCMHLDIYLAPLQKVLYKSKRPRIEST